VIIGMRRSDVERAVTLLDVVENLAENGTITGEQRLQLVRKATRELREIVKRYEDESELEEED
jgi:hypothetical protein